MRDIIKMILVLTVIAAGMGTILSGIESSFRDKIDYSVLFYVKGPAVREVLTDYENDPIDESIKNVTLEGSGDEKVVKTIFPAKKDGEVFAVAFEVPGKGYGGSFAIMIGVDLETGNLTGMRLMTHLETPGIGSLATEPEFYEQFEGLGVEEVALSSEGGSIDGISGATSTSTGVVAAVKKGLELFARVKDKIISAVQT